VLVGLFLAILELIRSQLIWVEQNQETGKISLRALTDAPPEEAVRKAIMRIEAEEAASQQAVAAVEQQPASALAEELTEESDLADEETIEEVEEVYELPIPIVEIPPADNSVIEQPVEEAQMKSPLPIPIAELPAKDKSKQTADEPELPDGQIKEQS
jgi:hypothetical protein